MGKEDQNLNKKCFIQMDNLQPKTNDPFQEIISKVGDHGRFQIIYKIVSVMGLAFAGGMAYMSIFLALNVPDHWCTVPGREKTNFSLEEWRNRTLPTEKDNREADTYSKCKMYDADFSESNIWRNWNSTEELNQTVCQNGWTYDDEWYASTIPSEQNWVCDKDLLITNIFVIGRIAEMVGSFVFGQLGDAYGRRLVYFISVFICSVGRIGSILGTNSYTLFLVFTSLNALAINSFFDSAQIIGMEICRKKDRSTIAAYQRYGWCLGTSVLPLLYWWLREWQPFMWIASVPTFVVLIFSKYVIESPRWLINKRRFGAAMVQFQKIADINGRSFNVSEKQLDEMFPKRQQERIFGMASLFNGWRLAKNTTIMGFSWCIVSFSYLTIVLFSSRMGGNPFLNFFLQCVIGLPASILGKYSADKFGRRLTTIMCFGMAFLVCMLVLIYAPHKEYENLMTGLTTLIRFLNAATYLTVNLQSLEMYPTCLRQTGIAFNTISMNAVSVLAPYLVYLGTAIDIRAPYYILGALFLIGSIGASFLPETLNRKLPDTMEEAQIFGKDDKFFSLQKPPRQEEETEAREKLNQATYAP